MSAVVILKPLRMNATQISETRGKNMKTLIRLISRYVSLPKRLYIILSNVKLFRMRILSREFRNSKRIKKTIQFSE